jgi:hypothetical protein
MAFQYSDLTICLIGDDPANFIYSAGFLIQEIPGTGIFSEKTRDSVPVPLEAGDWPLTQDWIRASVVAAIQAKYPGATPG